MPNLFEIEPADVEKLSPLDLVTLLNHLILRELRLNGLPNTDVSLNLRLNDKDGGIDAIVRWEAGPSLTRFFPSAIVGFQSKAGHRLEPAEAADEVELRDGSGLKPRVLDVLRQGGDYILFSAADMNDQQKLERLEKMRDTVRKHEPSLTPKFSIYGASDIVGWASESLWARTFVIRTTDRGHPDLLATYEEWAAFDPDYQNEYFWSDESRTISADIAAASQSPGSAFRLDGAPGLGKTRLVLEALRPLAEIGHGIVYYDAAIEAIEPDLLRALPAWRRNAVTGTLVVDNCAPELHQRILRELRSSQISCVTIDYRQSDGATKTLFPVSRDVVQRMVASRSIGLSAESAHRVVEFAEGWPLMAILVMRAINDGDSNVANLNDHDLLRRMVRLPDFPEAGEVLRALSIFSHVGFLENAAAEQEAVRQLVAPHIPQSRFFEIACRYQRRSMIAAIGRYWRVTPPPLANRQTREWLEVSTPALQDQVFGDALPAALKPALAQRINSLGDSNAAIAVAQRLTAPNARFGTLSGILGRENSAMIRSLCEVDPSSGMAALKRAISPLTPDELSNIARNQGRYNLVAALEGLAFHRSQFRDAALILFSLAQHETEYGVSNNSSGVLAKLFAARGSQTEASYTERLALLDELMQHRDPRSVKLLCQILDSLVVLDAQHHNYHVALQGGRPEMHEWLPRTYQGIFDYWSAAIDRLIVIAAISEEALNGARNLFAGNLRLLVGQNQWDVISRGLGALDQRPWPRAVGELRDALQYELKDAGADQREKVEELISQLTSLSFEEQLALLVINPPTEIVEVDGQHVDGAAIRAKDFARKVVSDDKVGEATKILAAVNASLSYEFGREIATVSSNKEKLIDEVFAALADVEQPVSLFMLNGIVETISLSHRELRESILDQASASDKLRPFLPSLAMTTYATGTDVRRVISYVSDTKNPEPSPAIFAGRVWADISEAEVRELLNALMKRGFYESVFYLLFFSAQRDEHFDDILGEAVLAANIIEQPVRGFIDYSVVDGAKRLFGSGLLDYVANFTKQLLDASVSPATHQKRSRFAQFWPALLEEQKASVWPAITQRYSEVDLGARQLLLSSLRYLPAGSSQRVSALTLVDVDELIAFAKQFPDDVPVFLASEGDLIAPAVGLDLLPTPLLLELIANFSDNEQMLEAMSTKLELFASAGPRAPYYEARIALLEKLKIPASSKAFSWRIDLVDLMRRRADAERIRSEELEGGIY